MKIKKKTEAVGLDIGSAAVKLVRLAKTERGYCVTAASLVELQAPAAESDGSAIVKAIGDCASKAQLRERSAVCAAAGADVMIRGFSFPSLPLKALDQAVQLEAQSVSPLDMKTSVLDYQLIEDAAPAAPDQGPRSGLMVVATERLINQRVSQLSAAGIKAILMDAEALALLNCLIELKLIADCGTAAVIDIGYTTTSVIIYGQNGLPFVRDLNIAGGSILRQIAAEQGLSEAAVRQVLCGGGADGVGTDQRNRTLLSLNNAIRPMVMMINDTLRFYSFQEKSSAVEKIFLCGGFSLMPTFAEMLTDSLPAETALLNPLAHMEWQAREQESLKACGPALAIAIGLAMRAL